MNQQSRLTLVQTLSCLLIFLMSCQPEPPIDNTSSSMLDTDLEEALMSASNGLGKSHYRFPASDDFGAIPQDPKNPLTAEKVALGQLLFHETGLALNPMQSIGEGKFSCASCHFASAGFQAGRFQGLAEGGVGFGINGEGRRRNNLYTEEALDVQPVRTPSAMNGAYQTNVLWNGQFGGTGVNTGTEAQWTPDTPKAVNELGFEGLETQAIAGLGVHRLEIDEDFLEATNYKAMFDDAFSDVPEDNRYNATQAGLAIAAYERTILANEAPFQKWLAGDLAALNEQEKRGAILFFGKAECSSCHNGPSLANMEFHALGMKNLHDCPEETFRAGPELSDHLGRGGFTQVEEDMFKFKVPQLYNLSDSPFYGHGSSFRTIRSVLRYKNEAILENLDVPASQLATQFQALDLTAEEIDDLAVFLEFGLKDPNLIRYQPASIPSGNCFPNNDALSRSNLGCD